MDAASAVLRARRILSEATPLNIDCGKTCLSACCVSSEAGDGMFLFPEEKHIYGEYISGFEILKVTYPFEADMLICSAYCDRKNRPLACMFFPVIPYIRMYNGKASRGIMLDTRAWPICPLMQSGMNAFASEFINACKMAAMTLFESEEHSNFVYNLTEYIDGYKSFEDLS